MAIKKILTLMALAFTVDAFKWKHLGHWKHLNSVCLFLFCFCFSL